MTPGLSIQAARATDEISTQVSQIQTSIRSAVTAAQAINGTVRGDGPPFGLTARPS